MKLAYNTAYKGLQTIRHAIVCHSQDASDCSVVKLKSMNPVLALDAGASVEGVLLEKYQYLGFLSVMAKYG